MCEAPEWRAPLLQRVLLRGLVARRSLQPHTGEPIAHRREPSVRRREPSTHRCESPVSLHELTVRRRSLTVHRCELTAHCCELTVHRCELTVQGNIAAFLLYTDIFARWTMVGHHVSHGGATTGEPSPRASLIAA
jgi:hypothetical protein